MQSDIMPCPIQVQFTTDEIIQPSDDMKEGGGRKVSGSILSALDLLDCYFSQRGRGQAKLDSMLQRRASDDNGVDFPTLADVIQVHP